MMKAQEAEALLGRWGRSGLHGLMHVLVMCNSELLSNRFRTGDVGVDWRRHFLFFAFTGGNPEKR